jgi:hypothetical protein
VVNDKYLGTIFTKQ